MTTIPDLIRLYIRGFKQLFYYRSGEKGEKGKLSVLKILIFIIYISAYIFVFLQFAETNISATAIQEYREYQENNPDDEYMQMFPLSIYGELALLMNLLVIVGLVYFLLIGDKPLTTKRLKGISRRITDFISSSRTHSIVALTLTLILFFLLLIGILIIDVQSGYEAGRGFFIDLSYKSVEIQKLSLENVYGLGKGSYIIWSLISPILVISALLISIDVFAKDYPKLMRGFNWRLVIYFIVCFVIAMAAIALYSTAFVIGEAPVDAPPITLEGFEGVLFFEMGLFWMFVGVNIVIFEILFLILIEILINVINGSNEIREKRKAILLFILPLVLVYVFLKGLPFVITFGPRLKALNNITDLLSLFVIVFFVIFGVLTIQEDSQIRERKDKFDPRRVLDLVPPYCKALFLLFLAFASFYPSLEANLFLALFGVQNEFRKVKVLLSIVMLSVAIPYIFWRYKPNGGKTPLNANERENQPKNVNNH